MMPESIRLRDNEPKELPDKWQIVSLSEISKCRGGIGFSPSLQGQIDGQYPFYKVSDMNLPCNAWSMTSANNYVDGNVLKELKAKTFPKGTIIFPKVGAAIATNKKRIITTDSLVDNNVMGVLISNQEDCLPDYLYCYFLGLDLKTISNSGPLPSINSASVNELRVPLPPLPEQRYIASTLSKIQEAIVAKQEVISRTRELKKALMATLFTEGLRGELTKDTEIGPVPKSWDVSSIGEKARLSSGGTPSRGNKEYWEDGLIPWVKTGEIDYKLIVQAEEHITLDGLENSSAKLFPKGTLLVAMYGQGITRGKVGILGLEAATNQACAAIFPKPDIDKEYLYYYLTHSYDRLRALSHGAQQKNLSAQIVASFKFSYPELEDQKQIVMSLKMIDAKLEIEESVLDSFQDLFKTMLHELMTGNIRTTPLMEA